jgi:hypothetical protein
MCQKVDFPCHFQALARREIAFHKEVIFYNSTEFKYGSTSPRLRDAIYHDQTKLSATILNNLSLIVKIGNASGMLPPRGLIRTELPEWCAIFFRWLFNDAFSYLNHNLPHSYSYIYITTAIVSPVLLLLLQYYYYQYY